MVLNPVSNGSVTGTGTLTIPSGILGAVLISADSSTAATVILRKDNSSGEIVYKVVTKAPLFTAGPIRIGSQALYYDVTTGSGGAIQVYEWVD